MSADHDLGTRRSLRCGLMATEAQLVTHQGPEHPRWAFIAAFVGIVAGGLLGGVIGYGLVDVQCTGNCDTALSSAVIIGSLLGAAGLSVVSAIGLRAMGEWSTVQDRALPQQQPLPPLSQEPLSQEPLSQEPLQARGPIDAGE